MSKMVNILVEGLNLEKEEFEVLNRDDLFEIIDNLDWNEIYKTTYKEAQGREFSGRAITYVDARNGELDTYWIQNNNYQHPFDSYYEIIVCSVSTPLEEMDDAELLEIDEYEEYQEGLECFNPELDEDKWDLEEFAEMKNINLEEREDEVIEYYATCNDIDIEDIQFQVDNLYQNQIEENGEE